MQDKFSSEEHTFTGFSMPHWNELPEIDLYIDQVTSLVNRHLSDFATGPKGALTSTMVNNYVKAKIIPSPVKKKYNRDTVAMLFVVVTLKSLFNIQEIGELIHATILEHDVNEAYDIYRNTLEQAFERVQRNQVPLKRYTEDHTLNIVENVCAAIAYQTDAKYRLAERRQNTSHSKSNTK